MTDLAVLSRAHELFAGAARAVPIPSGTSSPAALLDRTAGLSTGGGQHRYQRALTTVREMLQATGHADDALTGSIAAAHRDHALAREHTANVLNEARADTAAVDTPLARRELLRRRAARLRAQHGHVSTARRRARRHRNGLRALRYRLPPPHTRAGIAVRAALSRLGRPYVWGGSGPGQFDCSGLTQWSYAQAGLHLDRTTYDQIHDGIAVPRRYVRPGDLVFPSAGHVQLAIGNNLVVEAPHPGAAVRISPLGTNVQIRRPL